MNEAWRSAATAELIFSAAAALGVLFDIFVLGRRQRMGVMNAVWPLTALALGPVGLAAYAWFGRAGTARAERRGMWQKAFVSSSHCGSGCMVGDFFAEWIVFFAALSFAGERLWAGFFVDYGAALIAGFVFQYLAMRPMHPERSRAHTAAHTISVDFWSLTAFQVGMFGWMAFARFFLFRQPVDPVNPTFWLSMQAGMLLGFLTTYPVNWLLLRKGLKEAM